MEHLRFIELLFVLVKHLKRALRSPCRLDTQLKEWQWIKDRAVSDVSDLLCCPAGVLFHVFYPRLPMRLHQSVHRYPAESHSYRDICVFLSLLLTHVNKQMHKEQGRLFRAPKILNCNMTWSTSEQSALHRSSKYSSPSVTDRISQSKWSKKIGRVKRFFFIYIIIIYYYYSIYFIKYTINTFHLYRHHHIGITTKIVF